MADKQIKFPCISVEQPIGEFYVGAIDAADLISISYADIRRPEGRDIERYIGTQRDLSEGRVAEIKDYVETVDACFPTAVILAISREDAKYDDKKRELKIRRDKNVAKIIDGQHRIAGLEDYSGSVPFQLNVTIFIEMDIEDQAMVFATINLKQTKVTKSLAYDLFDYTKARSPQKTCHNIAKLMHGRKDSPFHKRIKILGKAAGDDREMQVITQATFVDRLMRLITRKPMIDQDRIKRGKKISEATGRRARALMFRNRFIVEKDAEIARIIWNYYSAIAETWPDGWDNFDRGMILARTTGFAAFMRLLPHIWEDLGAPSGIPKKAKFLEYLKLSNLEDADFNSDNFKPGSSGEGKLLRTLQDDLFE